MSKYLWRAWIEDSLFEVRCMNTAVILCMTTLSAVKA